MVLRESKSNLSAIFNQLRAIAGETDGGVSCLGYTVRQGLGEERNFKEEFSEEEQG